jgi:hypothetical protein
MLAQCTHIRQYALAFYPPKTIGMNGVIALRAMEKRSWCCLEVPHCNICNRIRQKRRFQAFTNEIIAHITMGSYPIKANVSFHCMKCSETYREEQPFAEAAIVHQ